MLVAIKCNYRIKKDLRKIFEDESSNETKVIYQKNVIFTSYSATSLYYSWKRKSSDSSRDNLKKI